MAVLNCKMCGGGLELTEAAGVAVCEYCGTRQTVSSVKDENLQNAFNRANALRLKSDFDKAELLYEKILQADDTQAEAYWGLILCKYGIEYVEDPKTLKRLPTCHRTSFESIIADDDYKSAINYADAVQKEIYEAEAKEIDRIQKEIVALSSKEEPYDVFICYKETDENGKRTPDSVIANDIYHHLTNEGFKVFFAAISLENKLGSAYEPCIFAALNSAKIMLVLGTKPEYFNAVWVKNEWSRYLKLLKNDRDRLLIPCYRDMDAYELPDEFSHLQAQDMSKIGFINDVIHGIKKVLKGDTSTTKNSTPSSGSTQLILADEALYEGEVFADLPHGRGKAQYKNGDEYVGEWNRGIRSGQGKLTQSDRVYEGSWINDKQNGQGKLVWKDGREWVGEFKDDKLWNGNGIKRYTDTYYDGPLVEGKRHGRGKTIWNEGGEWVGEFKDDKRWNGNGIMRYTDSYYDGPLVEGKKHGRGKMIWNEGGEWVGEFKDDKRWNGNGINRYIDGYYEGPLVEGKKHGHGKFVWKEGGQWVGEFKDDKRWNGNGINRYTDSYYDGPLVEGKMHGRGKMIWNEGGEWVGEFKDDKRWNGNGINRYADGYYEGPLVEGKRHGRGKMIWKKGGQWVGEFKDDELWNGNGIMRYTNGYYDGPLVEGKRHGRGKTIFNDGTVEEGEWKNDKLSTGCYVATCVYGSYDCPAVWTLRRFRDNTLAVSRLGRAFIHTYYAISPTIVRLFGKTVLFKKVWKPLLNKLVLHLKNKGVEDTPYQDKDWK